MHLHPIDVHAAMLVSTAEALPPFCASAIAIWHRFRPIVRDALNRQEYECSAALQFAASVANENGAMTLSDEHRLARGILLPYEWMMSRLDLTDEELSFLSFAPLAWVKLRREELVVPDNVLWLDRSRRPRRFAIKALVATRPLAHARRRLARGSLVVVAVGPSADDVE